MQGITSICAKIGFRLPFFMKFSNEILKSNFLCNKVTKPKNILLVIYIVK